MALIFCRTPKLAVGGFLVPRAMRSVLLLSALFQTVQLPAYAQSVVPQADPSESAGERPYEMVWANRKEPAPPTLTFEKLEGWSLKVEGGAQATVQPTHAQNVWNRPVARVRYRGEGKGTKPRLTLLPPQPISLPADADSIDLWVFGNRWSWENPPDTPPLRLALRLQDGDGKPHEVNVDEIRWKEWWLVHKRIAQTLKPPLTLTAIEFSGGWQTEWREILLDSLRFYREDLSPLTFALRPKRNLTLFPGQSPGANTGPGKLPCPTREETILPMHMTGKYRNRVNAEDAGFVFSYEGADAGIAFHFDPAAGLSGICAEYSRKPAGGSHSEHTTAPVWVCMKGAAVRLSQPAPDSKLISATLKNGIVSADYSDGTRLQLRIWQKSLVLDVINSSGQASELSFGQIAGVTEPRTIFVPYLTYGGGAHLSVLVSRAREDHVFTSIWLDWYRSNGSEPYAAESAGTNTARINGGVRYLLRTDGKRNPMFERVFITVSPMFEEVLPVVPNGVGLHAREATDQLWQESWGPDDYEKQMRRSRMLRAYGIEKLIQCNHEITWRDGGESFTLRTRSAPKKGGDEALAKYVKHQRGLGWFAGLYSNYTDYAPVNEFWSPDGVQRIPEGDWRAAWPRCYAEKPLKAVEFDAMLAPQIKAKYNPNSAYTDVHTAVSPWGYNDYDARVPGAGTFAQTFYAYAELLRNDSRVYGGPIFSEGTYHWLYAGLADGNYALAYDGRPLAIEPLLPVFDLYQIHTRECDIGMGWTAHFCDPIPDWKKPENLDRAIDRFLLHTLAYGHIGWLVEEDYGMARVCRSYYMLQQVQARYGLAAPKRIAFWDGVKLVNVSEALVRDLPRSRRQLLVQYPGLELWLNDHPSENWEISPSFPGKRSRNSRLEDPRIILPPAGWAAFSPDHKLLTYSALGGTNRADYLRSPDYVYLDGRGHWFDPPEGGSNGGLAIQSPRKRELEVIRISGEGEFVIRRPFGTRGNCVVAEAFDVEGRGLGVAHHTGSESETRIQPVDKAVRYVLRFQR